MINGESATEITKAVSASDHPENRAVLSRNFLARMHRLRPRLRLWLVRRSLRDPKLREALLVSEPTRLSSV